MATIKRTIDPHIIKMFSAHKAELHEKFEVESLAIFGSVSRGSARPDSDIDILVKYHKTPGIFAFLELKRYLENMVGRPVDLVTEGALKKQLRDQIIKEAIRVA
jgi:predicted nucleotidyltransferase